MKTFLLRAVIGIACTGFTAVMFAQNTLAQLGPASYDPSAAVASNQAQQQSDALLNVQEIMDNRAVQIASTRIYRDTLLFPRVNAMFVTYQDGQIGFVRWNGEQTRDKAVWNGPIPEGTIAVVHTHPAHSTSEPCAAEYRLANGKQIAGFSVPVYVLHHDSIVKAVPGSYAPVHVREIGWLGEFAPKNGEPSPVLARQVNKPAGSELALAVQ